MILTQREQRQQSFLVPLPRPQTRGSTQDGGGRQGGLVGEARAGVWCRERERDGSAAGGHPRFLGGGLRITGWVAEAHGSSGLDHLMRDLENHPSAPRSEVPITSQKMSGAVPRSSGGQGDKGTRGQGDKGTRGQGDKGTRKDGAPPDHASVRRGSVWILVLVLPGLRSAQYAVNSRRLGEPLPALVTLLSVEPAISALLTDAGDAAPLLCR
jgi:hypothetical protein